MFAFMAQYCRLLRAIAVLEKILGVLLIFNIVINIGVQVFSRYVLDYPLIWVEELATYSFIWATFIGASLGLKQARHVKIETFVGRLPPRYQAWVRAFGLLAIMVLLLILLPQAWKVMGVEGRSLSISLPVAIPRSWFYSIPLMIFAASMTLSVLYLLLAELMDAVGLSRPEPILFPTEDPPENPNQPTWEAQ